MGCDFGSMTRFWISMTELFIIINSFMITVRSKNQLIYQWVCGIQIIWKLSCVNFLRVIVWALNSAFFLYWFFPYGSQSSQIIQSRLNHSCLVDLFSLHFSGSKFLTNFGSNFVHLKFVWLHKLFCTQVFVGFAVISFFIWNCFFKNAQLMF